MLIHSDSATAIERAKETAESISRSAEYQGFIERLRREFPWRFQMPPEVIERDYLRIVDHHLRHLIPKIQRYIRPDIRRVLDFGCGSGGSAIALALVNPELHCCGTDIDAGEIAVARERAKLYNVADRCEFHHVAPSQPLPLAEASFDFSLCSSVLEYAIEPGVRRFCVQEMLRLVHSQGLMFFAVPNRLYPFEIHTHKWGWNYFPKLLNAQTVDVTFWEVRKLAEPHHVELHNTPISQLLRPWSAFCLIKK
jgi:SAM-dependent methyltransferase